MRKDQFFEKLAELLDDGWVAFYDGDLIRIEPVALPKQDKPVMYPFCPVTAVAFRALGNYWPQWEFDRAAANLGMAEEVAKNIVRAADNKPELFSSRIFFEEYRSKIERALQLKAV